MTSVNDQAWTGTFFVVFLNNLRFRTFQHLRPTNPYLREALVLKHRLYKHIAVYFVSFHIGVFNFGISFFRLGHFYSLKNI